jgi:hypothetical protein
MAIRDLIDHLRGRRDAEGVSVQHGHGANRVRWIGSCAQLEKRAEGDWPRVLPVEESEQATNLVPLEKNSGDHGASVERRSLVDLLRDILQ